MSERGSLPRTDPRDPLVVCIAGLAAAYPGKLPADPEAAKDTVSVYFRALRDLPLPLVEQAVADLIRTSRYFPTIAEIRDSVVERALNLPSRVEAAEQLARGRARDDFHPLVYRGRNAVGDSFFWRTAEEPGILAAQALRHYEQLRADLVANVSRGLVPLDAAIADPTLGYASADKRRPALVDVALARLEERNA